MALLGMFNVHRHGAINSAAIVLYALTSCVSGYVSCSFYTQINGQRWVWNIILTSSLFSGESEQESAVEKLIGMLILVHHHFSFTKCMNILVRFFQGGEESGCVTTWLAKVKDSIRIKLICDTDLSVGGSTRVITT